jgi:phospholipase C
MKINRRNFLKAAGAGAALGALPPSIQRALAIQANNATGTIADVKHVVIIMQENRSFDHYFGTMPGVRGFSDRFPIPTTNGNVWSQIGVNNELIQPYYLDPASFNGYWIGGDHTWPTQHAGWNQGNMVAWPKAKSLNATMGYLEQGDIPFYRALASAFTICDAYHCSVLGPTMPNRLHQQSGTNGPHFGQGAVIATENCWQINSYQIFGTAASTAIADGLTWPTYAELLQEAGISWKVYSSVNENSFGFNLNGSFSTFRAAFAEFNNTGFPATTPYSPSFETLSPPYGPLFKGYGNTCPTDNGIPSSGFLADMAADIQNNSLPQVSWIIMPQDYCEHPLLSVTPMGEWYIEQLLNTLTANPDVWAQTVLLFHYDENDALFDHMPPPAPPSPIGGIAATDYYGKSTVSTEGEYLTMGPFPGETSPFTPDGNPVGLGIRVPMLVISPWSVGGYVNSQVFDHTSTLQFLFKVFGVSPNQNITPWRQAVVGDLTSCFNFATPNNTIPTLTPAPTQAQANALQTSQQSLPTAPADAAGSVALPTQPLALVPSKALPYKLHTSAVVNGGGEGVVELEFSNTGTQAAVFHVYDQLNLSTPPRRYTVEAGKQLSDTWNAFLNTNSAGQTGIYSLWVLGPGGFHREFTGNVNSVTSGVNPEVRVCYDEGNNAVYLTIMNTGTQTANVAVTANAYFSTGPWTYTVAPGAQTEPSWSLVNSHGWYDFTLSSIDSFGTFTRRFAGRVETGQDSFCDPAMGVATASA